MIHTTTRESELDRLRRALSPPSTHAEIVDLPMADFLMIDGSGSPEGEAFRDAVHALFTMDAALHLLVPDGADRPAEGMPLEVMWGTADDEAGADGPRPQDWSWTAMVAQPARITPALVNALRERIREREDLAALDRVRLGSLREGRCAQIMHIGPYAAEAETRARLRAEINALGYEPFGPAHEIYLGDPREAEHQQARTVLRIPIHVAA